MLRFRDLSASFSRFWGLRFRSRVLSFRDRVLRFRDLGASFSSFGCFVLRSSFSSASFSKLPVASLPPKNIGGREATIGNASAVRRLSTYLLAKKFAMGKFQ